jgi:hypothetical protein
VGAAHHEHRLAVRANALATNTNTHAHTQYVRPLGLAGDTMGRTGRRGAAEAAAAAAAALGLGLREPQFITATMGRDGFACE